MTVRTAGAIAFAVVVVMLLASAVPSAGALPGTPRAPTGAGVRASSAVVPCSTSGSCASTVPPAPTLAPRGSAQATGWAQLLFGNASAPGDRTQPYMAYDPQLGKVVMFGGYDGIYNQALNDTWTFNNNSWSDLTSSLSHAPSPRWGGHMVWDPDDQRLVLFGGRDLSTFYNETWTFNGTNWTQVTSLTAPGVRAHFSMEYDPVDHSIMLAGGDVEDPTTFTWSVYNDTWTWDNGTWSNVTTIVRGTLTPRIYAPAAFDPWNGSIVIEGGTPAEGCVVGSPVTTYLNHTAWSYPSYVGPANVSEGEMVYDPAGPFLFAYGGELTQAVGCPQINETWVRANGTWVEITASAGLPPSARYLSGVVYDAHDSEVLLFGGNSNGGYMADTWVYRVQPIQGNITATRAAGASPLVTQLGANLFGGSEVYQYNWSFDDGSGSTLGPNVTHTFSLLGTYNVRLNVTDLAGRTFSTNLTVRVLPALTAYVTVTPTVGSVPLAVSFAAQPSGGLGPYTGSWNFGDGSGYGAKFANHTYVQSGNFTAIFTASDAYGDQNLTKVLIRVAPTLAVTVHGAPNEGIVPFDVNFTASPQGGIPPYRLLWTFGDGGNATTQNPEHLFTASGAFTVSLTVNDSVGRLITYTTVVRAYAPLSASVHANVSLGVTPLPVEFSATGSGGDGLATFTWDFGDGSGTVLGVVADHVFTSAGAFTVRLTLGDLYHNITTDVVVTVVAPLSASLTAVATTSEVGGPFPFHARLTGGAAPFNITWSFGDGSLSYGSATANHSYRASGSYSVRLVVVDALAERSASALTVGVARALTVALVEEAPSVILGASDNLSATVTGGVAPVTLSWSGLPPGCAAGATAVLACTPNETGTYPVEISVLDALGFRTTANVSMSVLAPSTLPTGSTPSSTVHLLLFPLIGIAVLLAGVGAGWVLLRRRRGSPPVDEGSSEEGYAEEPPTDG